MDITRKLPLIRSQKELDLDEDTKVSAEADEDTINTASEQTRLKDIPVPVSLPQTRVEGTHTFTLPKEHVRAPPPCLQLPTTTGTTRVDDPVDWDVDPAGFRFLTKLNKGSEGYSGPPLEEAVFEKLIDRFEKAVKDGVMPELKGLRVLLTPEVPDATVVDVCYNWWLARRKQLAMPLIRLFRPAPDPEDPDTTGVAFRPREKEGVRRLLSNNKKTYNLMAQLHDEFTKLKQLSELVKRRERLKLDYHQASGEYTEAAHRTLMHRLHRQRTGQGGWKDDLDMDAADARPSVSHKKGASMAARPPIPPPMAAGGAQQRPERSHHKKRQAGPGRPPKEGAAPLAGGSNAAPRERDRTRDRDRHRSHRAAVPPAASNSFVATGLYLRPSDGAEEAPTYEDVDSEEEAFAQLVLTVDTQRRDELAAMLPRHLRDIQPPAEVEMPPDPAAGDALPQEPDSEAPTSGGGYADDDDGATNLSRFDVGMSSGGSLSLGAAAAAAAVAALKARAGAPAPSAPSTLAAPSTTASGVEPIAGSSLSALPGKAAGLTGRVTESTATRPMQRTVIGRLRIGRGGRVLIDRDASRGGPRYTRTCWHTVVATPGDGHESVGVVGNGGGSSGSSSSNIAAASDAARASLAGYGTTSGDDGGGSNRMQPRPILPGGALMQMLQSGRACSPQLLDQGINPDEAWRRNEPLPIKRSPLLFDFKWLPRPEFVPSKTVADAPTDEVHAAAALPPNPGPGADASSLVGRKRKASEVPGLEKASANTNGTA